jgi:hypothetical protein
VTSSKPFERILQDLDAQIGHPDMNAFEKALQRLRAMANLKR